jgi:hypothetical protein
MSTENVKDSFGACANRKRPLVSIDNLEDSIKIIKASRRLDYHSSQLQVIY